MAARASIRWTIAATPNGVTIDLEGQSTGDVALFSSLEDFIGSNRVDTLLGTNGADAIAITANNTGTLGTQTFSGIENIDASGGDDILSLADGTSLTGTFTGAAVSDTINFTNYTTDLTIDLQNPGKLPTLTVATIPSSHSLAAMETTPSG